MTKHVGPQSFVPWISVESQVVLVISALNVLDIENTGVVFIDFNHV